MISLALTEEELSALRWLTMSKVEKLTRQEKNGQDPARLRRLPYLKRVLAKIDRTGVL